VGGTSASTQGDAVSMRRSVPRESYHTKCT
jgi:hypothetical protein